MGVIYYARCKVNGKGYVGVDTHTNDGSHRWCEHVRASRKGVDQLLKRAIRKYGADNFIVHPVWEHPDKEVLFDKEDHFIKWFGTKAPHGYNMVDGGGGLLNPCAEMRAKVGAAISAAKLGVPLSPEARANIKAAMARPEVCARLSGNNNPMKRPEVRTKVRATRLAKNPHPSKNALWKRKHREARRASP